ncbi:energy transducer TonB [Thermosulfurimonas marina]|uniref:energy transducer TonB n=1 Tax=Thermosulfurimonas marina TaxID=2047767 RepID=UPI00144A6B4C|nr:energy transducer TonB [Thermosulfurimonas marina]
MRRRLEALKKEVSQKEASGGGREIPENFGALLRTHLQSFWEIPASLSGRRDLSALVVLRLSSTGELLGYRFLRSSGNPLFDRAVEAALKAASPYPPPGRPLEIRVLFRPEGLS